MARESAMKTDPLSVLVVLMAIFFLSSGVAQNVEWTIEGTVSCSVCVPNGATRVDLECARNCLAKDINTDLVIVEDNDYHVFQVDNPTSVRSYVARHVMVTGYRGQHGFHVVSVRTL